MNFTRRNFLQKSALGLGSVAAVDLLARQKGHSSVHFNPTARRIIYIFLEGGLSQLDSYDHKPALEKIRGKTASRFNYPTAFLPLRPRARSFLLLFNGANTANREPSRAICFPRSTGNTSTTFALFIHSITKAMTMSPRKPFCIPECPLR